MKKVIVIGGGIAGLQTVISLRELGIESIIIEKSNKLGGKLNDWDRLFPSQTPAGEVLNPLVDEMEKETVHYDTTVSGIETSKNGMLAVTTTVGRVFEGDAVVVATGFDLFDARLKEEYGYGIYENVITSADLERMFKSGKVTMADGRTPERVAFVHCVGSRDEKVMQNHCSRVCCVTGVKQAIEIKEMLPECHVHNFYMDIRMFGAGYEEMYREAQQKWSIDFIRGRISEASQTQQGRVQLKAEDTLIGRPLKMTVDLLVLLVGMCSAESNEKLGLSKRASGFFLPKDAFAGGQQADIKGVFYAGTATAPKNVGETLSEAASTAMQIKKYFQN